MEDQATRLILIMMACLALTVGAFGQKKELISEPEAIEARVVQELDAHQQTEDWAKWLEKSGVKGMFAFDITVWNKGEVVAVRTLGRSDGAEIKHQNALKDYVKTMKFPFKVPKGKRYKVTYNFMIE